MYRVSKTLVWLRVRGSGPSCLTRSSGGAHRSVKNVCGFRA